MYNLVKLSRPLPGDQSKASTVFMMKIPGFTLPLMSKCLFPVMNEPLLWIVVIQTLVGAVLFPRERKKSSVQLKNVKKNKTTTSWRDCSTCCWISVLHETAQPCPHDNAQEGRKQTPLQHTASTFALNCSLRCKRNPTHENTSSWRKDGQIEVSGVPT